jgi:hypothetical protein
MYQQPEQEMRVVCDVVAEMKALKEENAKLQKVLAIRHTIMTGLRKQVDDLTHNVKIYEDGKKVMETEAFHLRKAVELGLKAEADVKTYKEKNTKLRKEVSLLKAQSDASWDAGYEQGCQSAREEADAMEEKIADLEETNETLRDVIQRDSGCEENARLLEINRQIEEVVRRCGHYDTIQECLLIWYGEDGEE